MSAMMVDVNTRSRKIFIRYDFKQVRDAVQLLLFSEKTNHFEKVFIYANPSRWETDVLLNYVDDKTYEAVCRKLQYLFELREVPADFEAIDVKKAVKKYARLLV